MKGWLIYAMGGGWGHLSRAIAIARPLAHHQPVHILTNSPYAPFIKGSILTGAGGVRQSVALPHSSCPNQDEQGDTQPFLPFPNLHLHTLPPAVALSEARYQIWRWLQTLPFTGLMVDTLPRGIAGELMDLLPELSDRHRILIHRDLNPRYVTTHHLTDFVRCHYERIWIPGEGETLPFATLPQVRQSAPWLVRQPGELGDRSTVSTILRLEPDDPSPLVLIVLTGQAQEHTFFMAVAEAIAHTIPHITVRIIAAGQPDKPLPYPWIAHYPAMDLLWMADGVISSGGYNITHECAALQVPLIAVPWKRLYDRQARRLKRLQKQGKPIHIAYSLPEVVSTLEWMLASSPPSRRQVPPDFVNGAIAPEVLKDLMEKLA